MRYNASTLYQNLVMLLAELFHRYFLKILKLFFDYKTFPHDCMQKGKSSFVEILHFCIFSNFKLFFFQGLEYLRLRHSFFVPMISFKITRF